MGNFTQRKQSCQMAAQRTQTLIIIHFHTKDSNTRVIKTSGIVKNKSRTSTF